MQRVSVYIDGLNLYCGIDEELRQYLWLDVRRMSMNLLKKDQSLKKVHYFTARMSHTPKSREEFACQKTFLNATETLQDVCVHFGYHLSKEKECPQCGLKSTTFEEKMTDVNIAVQLLEDTHDSQFDTAIVVSADSDLVSPIRAVRNRYKNRRVIVAFPPKRDSKQLSEAATGFTKIGAAAIRQSQLPTKVTGRDGRVFTRPPAWT